MMAIFTWTFYDSNAFSTVSVVAPTLDDAKRIIFKLFSTDSMSQYKILIPKNASSVNQFEEKMEEVKKAYVASLVREKIVTNIHENGRSFSEFSLDMNVDVVIAGKIMRMAFSEMITDVSPTISNEKDSDYLVKVTSSEP